MLLAPFTGLLTANTSLGTERRCWWEGGVSLACFLTQHTPLLLQCPSATLSNPGQRGDTKEGLVPRDLSLARVELSQLKGRYVLPGWVFMGYELFMLC